MTREEFETRVGMKVSDKLFARMNEWYMDSDKDKDEFCKMFANKAGRMELSTNMVFEIIDLKKSLRASNEQIGEANDRYGKLMDKYAEMSHRAKEAEARAAAAEEKLAQILAILNA